MMQNLNVDNTKGVKIAPPRKSPSIAEEIDREVIGEIEQNLAKTPPGPRNPPRPDERIDYA